MLTIEKLTKSYRGADQIVRALVDIDLTIGAGEFVAVRGPSGCGKTTLLLAAGGLLAPDAGSVRVDGEDLYHLSPDKRARLRAAKIGFVFQQFHLVPYLSVLDNVLAPALALPLPGARERANELLGQVGLAPRVRHVPAQLSTGERQRTALARALLHRPRLILADEPTGNLDRDNAQIVLEQLAAFARGGGAVFLATHDPLAASFAQRSVELREGKLGEPTTNIRSTDHAIPR